MPTRRNPRRLAVPAGMREIARRGLSTLSPSSSGETVMLETMDPVWAKLSAAIDPRLIEHHPRFVLYLYASRGGWGNVLWKGDEPALAVELYRGLLQLSGFPVRSRLVHEGVDWVVAARRWPFPFIIGLAGLQQSGAVVRVMRVPPSDAGPGATLVGALDADAAEKTTGPTLSDALGELPHNAFRVGDRGVLLAVGDA